MFLKMPYMKGPPMPISYELYCEFAARQETSSQIAKAAGIVCMMCGILFGAYRWLASGDLWPFFVFAGAGVVAALIASIVIGSVGTSPMGNINGSWLKAQKSPRSARADTDQLF
ncbi:hypothetical protein [Erythrobacter oryzae]|uniref:hypothetical protein n=1 Tax=Erythrobacter oryzae TaxID=3019556 RepID=UPI002556FB2E|nr:hypothetical protein [Erythrobacter sp. COR-2]